MTTNAGPCARAFDYLVEGGDPANDAEVAAHLGSCLTCFRTMTELADLPELVGRLRSLRERPAAAEPDAAFWEALPAKIADAVAVRPAAGGAAVAPPAATASAAGAPAAAASAAIAARLAATATPAAPARSARRAWRRPLLLGAAGMAAAAAVALLLAGGRGGHRGPRPEREAVVAVRGPTPSSAPGAAGPGVRPERSDDDDLDGREHADGETTADEIAALDELDEPALRHLARSLARSEL